MTNPDGRIDRDQNNQLMQSVEEALDKVYYSKSRHPIRDELKKQLEELNVNIRHNQTIHADANSNLSAISRKIDVLSQMEYFENMLSVRPEYPSDAKTNAVSREGWLLNIDAWEHQNRHILAKLRKLEDQLGPSLFDKIRSFFS